MSKSLQVDVKTVQRWENGSSAPKFEDVVALAGLANVSLDWIATGGGVEHSKQQDRLIEIPRYDVKVSAGNGAFTDAQNIIGQIPFLPDFFTKNLQRAPENMIIVDAKGDSMSPTMEERDLLMIDTSTADDPLFGGVYAFSFEDALFVKRLQKMPNGILATSDNKEYERFTIPAADLGKFNLIGRVVWIGRMM
ncbi:S24 family peptidase [Epibacterium ulvae]|uniref:S24 family peptidase n=1 Tax=Epibacterium ulvae TaxID=1156985 RepID=UPI00249061DE|nr:S24 family peptidase [Epibacterium ulvae]